jgi:adenine-specific DNA-methyltransferase
METVVGKGEFFSIEYVPKSGRNKGHQVTLYYKGAKCDLIAWLKDIAVKKGNRILKMEKAGTYWEGFPLNNLTKEGGVQFPHGKKPEALIKKVLDLATIPGDLVLDSFAGSGTTGAVAHKMGRKWIMCELREHCHTHIVPRMKQVIDGTDQGGISKTVNWQGGGGFNYYRLAESLLVKDNELSTKNHPVYTINPRYDEKILIRAICKIENFRYRNNGRLHGISSESRFLHITTNLMTQAYLDSLVEDIGKDQSLLIYCTRKKRGLIIPDNIEIKKIPRDLLNKCDFEEEKI